MVSGTVEELHSLYRRGDYEVVASRAEQLLHRQRAKEESKERPIFYAARASALIQLGRLQDAVACFSELEALDQTHPAYPAVSSFLGYARPYVSWASNDGVVAALESLAKQSEPSGKRRMFLEAQLLYRLGRYIEAAGIYGSLFKDAKEELVSRTEKPAGTTGLSLWSMTGRRSQAEPHHVVSEAEIDDLRQTEREIGTNLMAALVLAGHPGDALSCKSGLGDHYELEYNAGCAAIAAQNWSGAGEAMAFAERLFRSVMDEEEDDIDRGLSPILVQRAYVDQVAGKISAAQVQYAKIIRDRRADPASLAVAANNAAVATGQLALGKQQLALQEQVRQKSHQTESGLDTYSEGPAPKAVTDSARDRHAAVFDALKKMKATSGRDVERKLTYHQRRAMALNRAILLIQMGRLDASRVEIDKLKADFPNDPLVPLIEAALVTKKVGPVEADLLLQSSYVCKTDAARAARVALAADAGDAERAAGLLQELFPGRAAAIATAAGILESAGKVEEASSLLEKTAAKYPELELDAKKALGAMLLRTGNYDRAASVLNDALILSSGDDLVLGQLVLAMSFIDPDEAERMSDQLPALTGDEYIDGDTLEGRPPPRKRNIASRGAKLRLADGLEVDSAKPGVGDDTTDGERDMQKKAKKKKRKRILPKNYDPNGPPPDPERWLPKTLRSSYKKKKKGRASDLNFRGAQGADAAAADAAAAKNAERSAARIAESAADGAAGRASMPKGTKNKKKNRRR